MRALSVLFALALLTGLALSVGVGVALMLVPAAVLSVLLLHGVAPGEELIDRWRNRRAAVRRLRAPRDVARPRVVTRVRHAGRVIAFGLATRPPPAVQLAR